MSFNTLTLPTHNHLLYFTVPNLSNFPGHLGLTVLAVRKPDCVIGIGHALGLEGTFVKCCFFHDEEMALPVKFTCVARCHCPVNYEWFVPQRKIVEVTEKHGGYNVTITACVSGRGETCSEDSIGYIFRLDGEGKLPV